MVWYSDRRVRDSWFDILCAGLRTVLWALHGEPVTLSTWRKPTRPWRTLQFGRPWQVVIPPSSSSWLSSAVRRVPASGQDALLGSARRLSQKLRGCCSSPLRCLGWCVLVLTPCACRVQAKAIFEKGRHHARVGVVQGLLAQLQVQTGRLKEARASLGAALSIAARENDWYDVTHMIRTSAAVLICFLSVG